ncbi:MAG: sulfatase-like hydrolase/transferase, partial [Hyphomicrobiales bacterium]
LCTHIDQQIGALIGTIREEGILDETVIMFTSDHGDMLGNHGLWAKQTYYEGSSNIPMIVMGEKNDQTVGFNRTDDRIVGLRDIMPTLLGLADIKVPETVEGRSMVTDAPRDHLYGEFGEEGHSSRMIRRGKHKLIWYPVGNHFQLFDLAEDPNEMTDLSTSASNDETLAYLKGLLRAEMYGSDEKWLDGSEIVGEAARRYWPGPNRELSLTRGQQWPVPPINAKGDMKFFPEAPEGWDGSV